MPAPDTPGRLDDELAGLDALELVTDRRAGRLARWWATGWPKVAAVAIALAAWQAVAWSHWKPSYVLPGPGPVLRQLADDVHTSLFWRAVGNTARRAVLYYLLAAVVGLLLGGLVARSRLLRSAVGSLITGLQTLPSVVWTPLALVLFRQGEGTIVFVVVIGAAPSIANGFVDGIDRVPPLLLRSGRMLGARGLALWRHIIVPAALPSVVSGLKQGWAFAWRSLMAAEIIAVIAHRPALGERLTYAQQNLDYSSLYEWIIVILVIGIVADQVFGLADRALRRRWGLLG